MRCPKCNAVSAVVDSRPIEDDTGKRRRRMCEAGHRFTTYERASAHSLGLDRPLRDARELSEFRRAADELTQLRDAVRKRCIDLDTVCDLMGSGHTSVGRELKRITDSLRGTVKGAPG